MRVKIPILRIKLILLAIFFPVFLVMSGYAALPGFVTTRIHRLVTEEIDRNLTAYAEFDTLAVSMFKNFPHMTVTLKDFQVIGSGEFAGDTLVNIEEVDLVTNVFSLLDKRTDLEEIYLRNAQVHALILADGKTNFDIFHPDTTAFYRDFYEFKIEHIRLDHGTIRWEDRSLGGEAILAGVYYEGHGDFMSKIFDLDSKLRIDSLSLLYQDLALLSNKKVDVRLEMEMDYEKLKFSLKDNLIKINELSLKGGGSLQILKSGSLAIDAHFGATDNSFGALLSILPGVYAGHFQHARIQGHFGFEGTLKGIYEAGKSFPDFRLKTHVKEGSLAYESVAVRLDAVKLDAECILPHGVWDSLQIRVPHFEWMIGTNKTEGKFYSTGFDHCHLHTEVQSVIQLYELNHLFPLPFPVEIRGLIESQLSADGVLHHWTDSLGQLSQADMPGYLLRRIPHFSLSAKLKNGYIKHDTLPKAISDIYANFTLQNTTGQWKETQLMVSDFKARIGPNNPAFGFIKIKRMFPFDMEADIISSFDLSELPEIYPTPYQLKGKVLSETRLKGLLDWEKGLFPVCRIDASLRNGELLAPEYPEPLTNIHFESWVENKTGRLADTKVQLKTLTYELEGEKFSISGTLEDPTEIAYQLEVKGRTDLDKFTRVYPLPVHGIHVSGIIDTDVWLEGRLSDYEQKRFGQIRHKGDIMVENLRVKTDFWDLPLHIRRSKVSFNPKTAFIEHFEGYLGRSHLAGSGHLSNHIGFLLDREEVLAADLRLDCDTINLNEWLTALVHDGPVHDATSLPSIHALVLPKNIDFQLDSKVDYIRFDDIAIEQLRGEIRLHEGVLTMQETGFQTIGSDFSMDGRYDSRDPAKPMFDFQIRIDRLDINRAYQSFETLRTLVPMAEHTYGIVSSQYRLEGQLGQDLMPIFPTLQGKGTVTVKDAKVKGMKIFNQLSKIAKKEALQDPSLKDLTMITEIRSGELHVQPFTLKVAGLDAEAEGSNSLTDGTLRYLMKIALPPFDLVKIPFHVEGTYDNPKVRLGKGKEIREHERQERAAARQGVQ